MFDKYTTRNSKKSQQLVFQFDNASFLYWFIELYALDWNLHEWYLFSIMFTRVWSSLWTKRWNLKWTIQILIYNNSVHSVSCLVIHTILRFLLIFISDNSIVYPMMIKEAKGRSSATACWKSQLHPRNHFCRIKMLIRKICNLTGRWIRKLLLAHHRASFHTEGTLL